MVPEGAPTYALVVLSSLATIIASQALISGAFSLTRQAMQLGYFPRMTITHTTEEHEGQIYIPEMNTMLAVGCVLLVLGFRESGKLASAYGIAVTGTMAITSIVYYTVLRETRGWSRAKALPLLVLFLVFDIPFLVANLFKILDGGAVPVLVAMGVIAVMLVWQRGRSLIMAQYSSRYPDFEEARVLVQSKAAARVPGTAVFLSSTDKGMPPILVHHVERTRALHKQVLLLTVVTEDVPFVPTANRLQVMPLGHGFFRVFLNVGFMQQPNVPRALRLAVIRKEIDLELDEVTYFLARENIVASKEGNMGQLAETLFAYLQRNAVVADRHFRIPHMQVVEIGAQLDL
jgi:KUP system potassium uptake protein